MVVKVIRGGTCHEIHRHGKIGWKYIKDYEKNRRP